MREDVVWEGFSSAIVRIELAAGPMRLEPRPSGEVGDFAFGQPVHIITAFNPDGVKADHGANEQRHAELSALLDRHEVAATIGSAPDGSFAEPGYAIFDIDLDEALAIGRHFAQRAIFQWTDTALAVVAVDDSARSESGWVLRHL